MKRANSVGVELLLPLIAWGVLINLVGENAYTPRRSFYYVLGMVLVLLVTGPFARRVRAWAPSTRLRVIVVPVLAGCILAFSYFHLHAFWDQVTAPRNRTRLVDIGQNTYEAGKMFFSQGVNPYAFRAQIWHDVAGKPHVTREGESTRMYGIPYKYGYPYYPWMFFSYEAFRHLSDDYSAVRIGNLLLLLLSVVGLALLAVRLAPGMDRRVAGLAMVAALLCAKSEGYELFSLGITDIVVSCYLLFGLWALERGRDLWGGVLFGMAQGCKLLPGALVALVTVCWYRDPRRRLRFFAAFVAVVTLVVGPFVLWDPQAFFSATVLYYVTFHADPDLTSYQGVLPKTHRALFGLARWPLIALLVFFGFRGRRHDIRRLLLVSSASWLVFIAFNKMMHLNYIWAVYSASCASLVLQALPSSADSEGPCAAT